MKTFVRWNGNKAKHIKKFKQFLPENYNTYIEPFLGSGAMLLYLEPKKWIIADLNKDLVNCWKQVKKNPEKITEIFETYSKEFIPLDNKHKVLYCKKIASNIGKLPYFAERAAKFLLLKSSAFFGLITSTEGSEKFVFHGLDPRIYIDNRYFFLEQNSKDNIVAVSKFLNNSKGKIYCESYEKILTKAKEGDFVFLDPPYVEDKNYGFKYNKDEVLDSSFNKQLLAEVKKLDSRKVKWMMTQADTLEIKKLFKDYTTRTFKVYRFGSKSYVDELVITNYN